MSYQTKEQAMGYILKACFDEGIKKKEIKSLYLVLKDKEVKSVLDNEDCKDMFQEAATGLKWSPKLIKEVRNGIYWAHDEHTVEEAGEFLKPFVKLLE